MLSSVSQAFALSRLRMTSPAWTVRPWEDPLSEPAGAERRCLRLPTDGAGVGRDGLDGQAVIFVQVMGKFSRPLREGSTQWKLPECR